MNAMDTPRCTSLNPMRCDRFLVRCPLRRLFFRPGHPSLQFDSAFDGPAWGRASKCRDKHRELPERDAKSTSTLARALLCNTSDGSSAQHPGVHKLSRGAEMSPESGSGYRCAAEIRFRAISFQSPWVAPSRCPGQLDQVLHFQEKTSSAIIV
jgi:hypothetical protein